MSSRRARQLDRMRKDAIAATHDPSPDDLARLSERALVRIERAIEASDRTPSRVAGTVYGKTPYGKFRTPENQRAWDERAAERKELRQIAYAEGGFVSENHYVAYVKGILRQHLSLEDCFEAQLFAEAKAAVLWGTKKAAMLTRRAESMYFWGTTDGYKPTALDRECNNLRHAAQRVYDAGKIVRRNADTVSGQSAYRAWLANNAGAIMAWSEVMAGYSDAWHPGKVQSALDAMNATARSMNF